MSDGQQGQLHHILVADGDGVGPELMRAAVRVLSATQVRLQLHPIHIGHAQHLATGSALTEADLQLYEQHRCILKGPLTVPFGTDSYHVHLRGRAFTSANQALRQLFQLSANVRPARSFVGVSSSKFSDVDLVTFRENTEDVYTAEEHYEYSNSDNSNNSSDSNNNDSNSTITAAIGIKRITAAASTRIATLAFEYALQHHRPRVTVIHKANACRKTDGLFLSCCAAVAARERYVTAGIAYRQQLADSLLTALMIDHTRYNGDVLLTMNGHGDLISDLTAGMIGSLGLMGAAMYGGNDNSSSNSSSSSSSSSRATYALFEPTHGSAPDIAGRNIVNPVSILLSAAMMLQHLGEEQAAAVVEAAVRAVVAAAATVTPDLGGSATTEQMTDAIVLQVQQMTASNSAAIVAKATGGDS